MRRTREVPTPRWRCWLCKPPRWHHTSGDPEKALMDHVKHNHKPAVGNQPTA